MTRILPLILSVLCTCSCAPNPAVVSQVPVPTGYIITAQQRMQALQHWDLLAAKVAEQSSRAMEHYFPGDAMPVYVAPLGATPFAKAYREALMTHLIGYGVPIATGPEEAAVLEVNSGLVMHERSLVRSAGGVRSMLEPGFMQGKNAEGEYHPVPMVKEYMGYMGKEAVDAEIQINSALTYNGAYLYRDSSMFYVNLSQWAQYQLTPPPCVIQAKRYSLVNK